MATWGIITASTVATTRTEAGGPGWAATAVSLTLGLTLIVLALPRAAVEATVAASRPGLRMAESMPVGAATSPDVLASALATADIAAERDVSAEAWVVAGRFHAAAGRLAGSDARSGATRFQAAGDRFAHALALSPMDTRNWHRYTHALYASGQYLDAARAWRLSVLTGAFDSHMMFVRIRSGLALWRYMDLLAREAFGRQLLVHWRWGPDGLAELLHRYRGGAAAVATLAPWPDAMADLRRRMRRVAERQAGG